MWLQKSTHVALFQLFKELAKRRDEGSVGIVRQYMKQRVVEAIGVRLLRLNIQQNVYDLRLSRGVLVLVLGRELGSSEVGSSEVGNSEVGDSEVGTSRV
jgi:hypothetical protein